MLLFGVLDLEALVVERPEKEKDAEYSDTMTSCFFTGT